MKEYLKHIEVQYPIIDNCIVLDEIVIERIDNSYYRVKFTEKLSQDLFNDLFLYNDLCEN